MSAPYVDFDFKRVLNNDIRKIHDININLQYLELKWRGWHAQILPVIVNFTYSLNSV